MLQTRLKILQEYINREQVTTWIKHVMTIQAEGPLFAELMQILFSYISLKAHLTDVFPQILYDYLKLPFSFTFENLQYILINKKIGSKFSGQLIINSQKLQVLINPVSIYVYGNKPYMGKGKKY